MPIWAPARAWVRRITVGIIITATAGLAVACSGAETAAPPPHSGTTAPAATPSSTATTAGAESPQATGSSSGRPTGSGSTDSQPSAGASGPATGAGPGATSPGSPRSAAPQPTESAPIEDPVEFSTGVEVAVRAEAVTVEAETPGEVSGAAIRVTITATNGSTRSVPLDSAVVSLVAEDGTFAVPTTAGGQRPFASALQPGATADATYVFMIDRPQGREVTVSVNYAAGAPFASFTGTIA